MKVCARRFPLDELAVSIDAQAIVIMSARSTLAYAGISEGTVPIFSFPGRPSDAELAQIAGELSDRFVRKAG